MIEDYWIVVQEMLMVAIDIESTGDFVVAVG